MQCNEGERDFRVRVKVNVRDRIGISVRVMVTIQMLLVVPAKNGCSSTPRGQVDKTPSWLEGWT